MIKFFNNIESLHQFTLSLDSYPNSIKCHQCKKSDQFVSHGFIYKKQHQGEKQVVGKRAFCSNRSAHSGCGATEQLYLSDQVPKLHYNTHHLFVFLSSLIASLSIQAAYEKATGARNTRNAYRWLHRLQIKLMDYRCLLSIRTEPIETFKSRTKRFQIVLPTLQSLFLKMTHEPCAHYQNLTQTSFL